MFELLIKFKDGQLYWREFFNSPEEMKKWLAVEQTRPYWKNDFTTEVVDHTPLPDPAADAANAARKTQIDTLRARLAALDDQADLTAAEVKECLRKTLKLLRLRGHLE